MWHPECDRIDSPNFGYPRGRHGQLRSNVIKSGGGGSFWHSVVGSWQAARDRFLNPAQEASAHFIIRQVGRPVQMVDSADAAWCTGGELEDDPIPGGPGLGSAANLFFHGFEFEGGPPGNYSEPLTPNQLAWGVKLCHWLEDIGDWPRAGVYVLRETLWEHNWVYPTACPSGRMNWGVIIPALQAGPAPRPEEDDMFGDKDREKLEAVYKWAGWQKNIAGLEQRFVRHGGGLFLLLVGSGASVTRHHIANERTGLLLGLNPDWSDVVTLTAAEAAAIPIGDPVPNLSP